METLAKLKEILSECKGEELDVNMDTTFDELDFDSCCTRRQAAILAHAMVLPWASTVRHGDELIVSGRRLRATVIDPETT